MASHLTVRPSIFALVVCTSLFLMQETTNFKLLKDYADNKISKTESQ